MVIYRILVIKNFGKGIYIIPITVFDLKVFISGSQSSSFVKMYAPLRNGKDFPDGGFTVGNRTGSPIWIMKCMLHFH